MPKEMVRGIVGAALGIAVGIMLIYLGFFKTLLLVALAALGFLLSQKRDWPSAIADWITRLRSPWH